MADKTGTLLAAIAALLLAQGAWADTIEPCQVPKVSESDTTCIGIGDSHVWRGTLDEVTHNQFSVRGTTCEQVRDLWLNNWRRPWHVEVDLWTNCCGNDARLQLDPEITASALLDLRALARSRDGRFVWSTPPAALEGSAIFDDIQKQVDGTLAALDGSGLAVLHANAEWIRRGHHRDPTLYDCREWDANDPTKCIDQDPVHTNAKGNAAYTAIVRELPEPGYGLVWCVAVLAALVRRKGGTDDR